MTAISGKANPYPRQRRYARQLTYLIRRLSAAAFVLWAAFSLSFLILYALPSDPVTLMLGRSGQLVSIDPHQLAELRAHYLLDEPLSIQYLAALSKALTLDFGVSIQDGQPVLHTLLHAFPATVALTFMALLMAMVMGIGLALAASLTRLRWLHECLLGVPAVAISLPTFWVGLLLLQLLSFYFPVFPAMGNEGLAALILPALTLAIPTSAIIAQVLARSIADTFRQPFIEALRSKGVGRVQLLTRHVLHNAAIPLLSLTGIIIGSLLAGSVVSETVFSRQGIGRLAQSAVANQDIPMVQGIVLLAAVCYIVVNLLVDLLYPLLDPRITAGGKS